jgi:hypothetical protein
MIAVMDKRVLGFVTLLTLALASASRPAHAQDTAPDNNWFDPASDDGSGSAEAPEEPGTPPPSGPRPQPLSQAPSAPGPQAPPEQENVPETDPRAITDFRPTLDPYGTWVDDQRYGTVWVPNRDAVGSDFAPYVSAGHWALTDDGDWIWQSDYPFGDVVFHYGRWVWVPGTGWAWVAGRRYANAWVNWRVANDDYGYIGWAPMPPAWGWYGGAALSLGWYPPAAYVFCPTPYAFSYRVHSYIVRDRYVIHDVAAHTRNYSSGQAQHSPASPRVLPANSAPPRGPTLQSAHIPAYAAPASRVPMRSAYAGMSGSAARTSGSFYVDARPRSGYAPSSNGYRAVPSAASRSYAARYYSTPTRAYSSPIRSYSPPSQYSAPSRSYSAPTRTYAAPSQYSAPTRSYSAPTRSYSAPSQYSAPTRSYSAPAHFSAPAMHSAPSHSAPSFHAPSRR